MNEVRLLRPENLDIDAIIKADSQVFYRNNLKREYALFIINTLIKARANQRREMLENDSQFTNLSSSLLSKVTQDYHKYLEFFLKHGVMLTDNQFISGKKCKGYCFDYPYSGQKIVTIEESSYILKKAIRRQKDFLKEEQKKSVKQHAYLTKWWDTGKLGIDVKSANDWIENNKAEKIQAIKTTNSKTQQVDIENAINTAEDFKYLVSIINDRKCSYRFSGIGHRFYSPLTNLKKELRNYLTYDGKPLVSIDIKNSQPFFAIALFRKSFWSTTTQYSPNLNLHKLSKKLDEVLGIGSSRGSSIYDSIITLIKTSKNLTGQGSPFLHFIDLVVKGQLYEYIEKEFKPTYPNRFDCRQNVKKEVLRILYGDPKNEYDHFQKPCQTFKDHFPEVYSLFKLIKSEEYNLLPLLLQRIESYLVIDIICKEISKLHPQIPLFTIHDSIVTTKENEVIVEQIMSQQILEHIGHKPELFIENLRAIIPIAA